MTPRGQPALAFNAGLDRWARGVRDDAHEVHARATLLFVDTVVARTPVDEGVARNGWTVGDGEVVPSPLEAGVQGAGAMQRARVAVAAWRRARSRQRLVVANTVPYIRRLEYDGWSQQAPQGMLRRTQRQWPALVQRAAAEVRASRRRA